MSLKLQILCVVFLVVLSGRIDQASAKCPAVAPMANFNPLKFAGSWYAIKRYQVLVDALAITCTSMNATVSNGNILNLELCNFWKRQANLRILGVLLSSGVVNYKFQFGAGETKLSFFLDFYQKRLAFLVDYEFKYIIVDTDYTNYAVTYLCATGFLVGTTEIAWIYGRQRTLSDTYVTTAINALKAKNLNLKSWTDINQAGCR